MIIQMLLSLAGAWLAYGVLSFAVKYSEARKIDIPIVSSPIGQMNVFWMILQPILLPLLQRLPFRLGSFTRYNRRGWVFHDKCKMHLEYGDAWVHVTPSANWLYLSDADVVKELFSRRRDFIKPIGIYKMLEIFGRNLLTVEGEDWQRHRKITTPPFNEKNKNLVWVESLRQTRDMLRYWTRHDQNGVCSTVQDTKTLTLHVLARAGLGQTHSFQSAIDSPEPGAEMNYRDSISLILQNAVIVMMFPPKLLLLPFLPKKLMKLGNAIITFKKYMAVSPVLSIPKYTGDQGQHLIINNKHHFIPAKTLVLPNTMALHTHPRYWGEDALAWRPSRWIVPSTEQSNGANLEFLDGESLRVPRQGTFVPWSEGARVCPGKKIRSGGVRGCHRRLVPLTPREPYRSFWRRCRECSTANS